MTQKVKVTKEELGRKLSLAGFYLGNPLQKDFPNYFELEGEVVEEDKGNTIFGPCSCDCHDATPSLPEIGKLQTLPGTSDQFSWEYVANILIVHLNKMSEVLNRLTREGKK